MRLKSYFAASVAEAIENARVDLGPEAMLLNSRDTAPEQRHLGSYEVVFGITGEPLLPRRSEAVAQLFTPSLPQAQALPVRARLDLAPAFPEPAKVPPPPAAALAPVPSEIPSWKRTLEELVSRQEAPVPVASLPVVKPVTVPFAPVGRKPVSLSNETAKQPALRQAAASISRATAEASAPAVDLTLRPSPALEAPVAPSPEILADELVNLRQQIERVKKSLAGSSQQTAAASSRPRELDLLNAQMVGLGFSSAFAQKMSDAALERLNAFSAESASLSFLSRSGYSLEHLQQVLIAELQSRFQVKPELGVTGSGRKVVMLVGPPGAGKTTTLVKLAIKYGLEKRLPVHLLSLDTVRVGGSEQLATFSRILNVGFDALHTTAALSEALADCRTDQVILIDCPGYAPADIAEASSTASFLRRNPSVDVQLVLPAFMNSSSLLSASQRFSIFNPSKLLFTHLDKVDSVGVILEHTIKSSLPVSFLTNGQGIPQDLQEASKDRFTQGILNGAAASGAA